MLIWKLTLWSSGMLVNHILMITCNLCNVNLSRITAEGGQSNATSQPILFTEKYQHTLQECTDASDKKKKKRGHSCSFTWIYVLISTLSCYVSHFLYMDVCNRVAIKNEKAREKKKVELQLKMKMYEKQEITFVPFLSQHDWTPSTAFRSSQQGWRFTIRTKPFAEDA
mgnify:CR=1 FL=1